MASHLEAGAGHLNVPFASNYVQLRRIRVPLNVPFARPIRVQLTSHSRPIHVLFVLIKYVCFSTHYGHFDRIKRVGDGSIAIAGGQLGRAAAN